MTDDQIAGLAGAGLGDNLGVGEATGANQTQSWAFTTAPLADGVHNFTVTSTDAAGNVSAVSTLNVTIDTVAPNAPVITGNSIVNTNQVQLTGTAEAGSTVKLLDGTTVLAHGDRECERRLELHHQCTLGRHPQLDRNRHRRRRQHRRRVAGW